MSEFLRLLHDGLARCGVGRGKLLLAVSGGADSVALLCGCRRLSEGLGIALYVAHFNHRLRGEESDADARWVEALCRELEAPVRVGQGSDDLAVASAGVEARAREERYRFLAECADSLQCPLVATAHTADDQAETVLHHILRGTGLAGLAGIAEQRPLGNGSEARLIRPLLRVRREMIENWLAEIGQDCRRDETNEDARFTRNRIRHELLPLLTRDYYPGAIESLLRLSDIASEAEATLEDLAEALLDEARRDDPRSPDEVALDCRVLGESSPHLVREVFVRLWRHLGWPRQGMGYDHWNRLAAMTACPYPEKAPRAVTLPGGISCRRKKHRLLLRRSGATTGLAAGSDDPVQVSGS